MLGVAGAGMAVKWLLGFVFGYSRRGGGEGYPSPYFLSAIGGESCGWDGASEIASGSR